MKAINDYLEYLKQKIGNEKWVSYILDIGFDIPIYRRIFKL